MEGHQTVTAQYKPHAVPLTGDPNQPLPQKVTLVVNGILNCNEEDVKKSAQSLAGEFNIEPATVWYFHIKDDCGRVPAVAEQMNFFLSLAEFGGHSLFGTADPGPDRLAQDLQYFLGQGCQVAIHAHSRGALVTHGALNRLAGPEQQQLEVTTYGGVSLIPQSKANRVENIINLCDRATQIGKLCLWTSHRDDLDVVRTWVASNWVDHACCPLITIEQALSSSPTHTERPAVAQIPSIAELLPTLRVQLWSRGILSHDFLSYIRHSAQPDERDARAHQNFRKVMTGGILTWVVSTIVASIVNAQDNQNRQ